jgi:hypothetical protein
MSRQWFTPEGAIVNEKGSNDWVGPGGHIVNERALWTGSLSESLTPGDSYAAAATFVPTLSEGLTAGASVAAAATFAASLSEGLTAADSLSCTATFRPTLTESATPSVSFVVAGHNNLWGGCFVWLSSDNVTYQQVGEILTAARMGVLTGNLPSYGGANPDTTDSFGVNLSESDGDLQSVTAADAAANATLSVIKDAGGSLEFLSYRDATLTSPNNYTLGGQLYRALYGSTAGAHSVGAQFARLDDNIFKLDLPVQYIGKTLYVKLQSFNIYGGAVQDLADCTAYTYVVQGSGYGGGTGGVPTTPAAPTVTPSAGYNLISWTANPATDNVVRYEVWRANGTGASFGSAAKIGSSTGTNYTDSTAAPTTGYTYFVVAVNAVGSSSPSAGTNTTTPASGQPFGFAFGPRELTASKIVAYFDTPLAWTIPAGLTDSQGDIVDSDTATAAGPTAQTDFDIQSPAGTSIGTMRFAASSLTATFIKAADSSIAKGDPVLIVAPSNLNSIGGALVGTIKGSR